MINRFFRWTSKLKSMLKIGLYHFVYLNLREFQFFHFSYIFLLVVQIHGKYSCKSSRCAFASKLSALLCMKKKKKHIHWSESAIFRWCLNIQIEVKFKMKWIFGLWKGKVNFSRRKKEEKFTLNGETVEVIIWTF